MAGLPNEAVGAIVAAIIAGLVAFFSLIIAKEQSVSAFRQAWIDELRKDVAKVVSCVYGAHGTSIANAEAEQELWDKLKADLTHLVELSARIRLRLNPHETRPKERTANAAVLKALTDIRSVFDSPTPQFLRLEPLMTALVSNAQIVLKENWDLVRSGERMFRIVKGATLIIMFAAIAIFLVYAGLLIRRALALA